MLIFLNTAFSFQYKDKYSDYSSFITTGLDLIFTPHKFEFMMYQKNVLYQVM